MRYQVEKRAIILDHVGNYARFGLPDADREWSLQDKKGASRKEPTETPVFIKECPECFAVFSPTHTNGNPRTSCPFCGAILPKKPKKELCEVEAELQEISGFVLNYKTPEECHNYKELLDYAKNHGYKPGWAYFQARQRGMLR
jgi:hypothetical protein